MRSRSERGADQTVITLMLEDVFAYDTKEEAHSSAEQG